MAKQKIVAGRGFSAVGRDFDKGQVIKDDDFDKETRAILMSMGRIVSEDDFEEAEAAKPAAPAAALPGLPGAK